MVKKEGTEKIQEGFKTLMTDSLGAASYKKVKKAIATDKEMKTKYDSILAEFNRTETNE